MIPLVVLDMAGTTVLDDGLVEQAFLRALPDATPAMVDHVRVTMGQSKIVVFRELLNGETAAQRANAAFEEAYAALVAEGHCAPVPGAPEVITDLRTRGAKVAFSTGFSRATQHVILSALGWTDRADFTTTPAEAGRGRPYPDMVLAAVLGLGLADVRDVAVVGDTPSDVLSGLRSGARVVAGVLTGAGSRADLAAAGATHVLDSIRDLPAVLEGF
ncbi:phosphonatase-like hydrolase [Saccharothrix tamanrassetensis]|uniref:Phosphonatase-like hydrolase n=1 Tax=Saccharothrix tamanrassetensis TaxID=1051531 RepID=A0A841CVM4_9PSEU|nr:phosphonatase-like hydrolase [Saccharothrix tamanrassetensis]MBB5960005.1 phosphonatase-like hydrolase [Saccharothrix tamanrassetensis]